MKTTFNPQAFLAGLLPGNYGNSYCPTLRLYLTSSGALTSTYAGLDAVGRSRELIIYPRPPAYREEKH